MKTLLLLGGMTPDVTKLYYDLINRTARAALGGRHNAPLYMYSADLETMVQHAGAGEWDAFAKVYTDAIDALADKVDAVVVSAILAHKVAARLTRSLSPTGVPLLHIADCVAAHLKARFPHVRTVGLLGPKITMLDRDDPDFFVGRLETPGNGFKVLVPETQSDLEEVNRGMMEEVAKGAAAVTPNTKDMFVRQANRLIERGAQGIILGSTDLGFVVRQEDLPHGVIVIEPGAIHAEEAAKWALRS
ncbi:Asp/Glu/hydantoin racemase [Xylaria bambusicola]|uniref:Asp/Glu/hydantoin racemase n=1 Tax=Xylaria bambusicola TaxID=326684 RepID=UPI0020075CFB|nr:Asp/Glu/hydantoin racemase [Xylaria bambusicola]KAI0523921.1 Asp/Glu/hydantoin racemase [Xylaria bambusicola]